MPARTAPQIRSAGSVLSRAGLGHRYKTTMTATKEAELRKNTALGPALATINPPTAGPAARATLKPTEFKATAAGTSSSGTNSGTIDCHAGAFKADPA